MCAKVDTQGTDLAVSRSVDEALARFASNIEPSSNHLTSRVTPRAEGGLFGLVFVIAFLSRSLSLLLSVFDVFFAC